MPAAGVLGPKGGGLVIRGKLIIAGGLLIRSCGYYFLRGHLSGQKCSNMENVQDGLVY